MIDRARQNAIKRNCQGNVEFKHAAITDLPLDGDSVDCILSNCVINLVSEKNRVIREIYRVLKPGGRVNISDIVAKKPLPQTMKDSMSAYAACLGGAISVEDYRNLFVAAGFQGKDSVTGWLCSNGPTDAMFVDTKADLNVYKQPLKGGDGSETQGGRCCISCGPSKCGRAAEDKYVDEDFNEYLGMYNDTFIATVHL
jgi:SAM-dependent methyltransferase